LNPTTLTVGNLVIRDYSGLGPDLVLLHGYGASGFTWRNWIPALSRSHRVLNVDLKGFGSSPAPPDGRYSPHDHAREVLDALSELEVTAPILVGHSMGGGIALLTALGLQDDPARKPARGLVIVSGAAYRQRIPKFVSLARSGEVARIALSFLPKNSMVSLVLTEVQAPGVASTPEQVEGYAAPFRRPEVRYGAVATALNLLPPDLDETTRRYASLTAPTQLLWGELDRIVPLWVGQRLETELPNAQLAVLFGCGHVPQDEMPEESLEVVAEFLASLI